MCHRILKRRELIADLTLWADDLNLYVLECAEYNQITKPIVITRRVIWQHKLDRAVEYTIPRFSFVVGFLAPLVIGVIL